MTEREQCSVSAGENSRVVRENTGVTMRENSDKAAKEGADECQRERDVE